MSLFGPMNTARCIRAILRHCRITADSLKNMICLGDFNAGSSTMDGKLSYKLQDSITNSILLSGSHHAGVPPTTELNLPVIPASAYAAALKEYEDLDETDSEGDDLSW